MAGTVVVDAVKSSTTGAPTFQNTNGTEIGTLCRAWVNFNGTGTVAIRASFNVSSITDNGTGQYTVNFTNAFADTNYSAVGTARADTDGSGWSPILSPRLSQTKTTSAMAFSVMQYNMPLIDSSEVDIAFFR